MTRPRVPIDFMNQDERMLNWALEDLNKAIYYLTQLSHMDIPEVKSVCAAVREQYEVLKPLYTEHIHDRARAEADKANLNVEV